MQIINQSDFFPFMDQDQPVHTPPPALIDLDSVFRNKNPRLYKFLPKFVLSYLKRVIHQEEVNAGISKFSHLYGIDFLDAILKEFGALITYEGLENIPTGGRFIIAANHPLGGLDGMSLMWVAAKVNPNIVFPVNDLLMHLKNLRELFIPINKHGSNAGNVRTIDETFASDKAVLYFPAGLCSRLQGGEILDLEWKKSFISKARQHSRVIVPCFIGGRNSSWFYNLSRIRTFLGIKANIEMLYLVDEMFRQRGKEISMHFGKPIPYTVFHHGKRDAEWARLLKAHVYQLKNNINTQFNPD